jgi:TatA/E family protein of Tat protein translocase
LFPLFLEFLGTSEFLVILVAALVLFGPRKLPELSRSLGKSLAEFKRASEDFKRTWEQEVSVDQSRQEAQIEHAMLPADDSVIKAGEDRTAAVLSTAEPLEPTIARSHAMPFAPSINASSEPIADINNASIESSTNSTATHADSDSSSDLMSPTTATSDPATSSAAPSKRDWL